MEQQQHSDRFAYFNSPQFHQRMRELHMVISEEGSKSWNDMAKRLGCHRKDLHEYLRSLADENDWAHVPVGKGEHVRVSLNNRTPGPDSALSKADQEQMMKLCRKMEAAQHRLVNSIDNLQAADIASGEMLRLSQQITAIIGRHSRA